MVFSEKVSTDKITVYKNNNKIHTFENIDKIARSIAEYGYLSRIGVDENYVILYGTGRFLALKTVLGYKEIEVDVVDHLTEEQKIAYRIADNTLSEDSIYDYEALEKEVKKLQEINFDLDLTFKDFSIKFDKDFSNNLSEDIFEDITANKRQEQEDIKKAKEITDDYDNVNSGNSNFDLPELKEGDIINFNNVSIRLTEPDFKIKDSVYFGIDLESVKKGIVLIRNNYDILKNNHQQILVWHKGVTNTTEGNFVQENNCELLTCIGDFKKIRYNNLITAMSDYDDIPENLLKDIVYNFVRDTEVFVVIDAPSAITLSNDIMTKIIIFTKNGKAVREKLKTLKANITEDEFVVELNNKRITV
jgi:hypothetical protein